MLGFYEEGRSRSSKGRAGESRQQTVSEILEEIYPVALKSGISCLDYWDMSLKEISDTIKAYTENEEQRIKERAKFDYTQVLLMSYAIHSPGNFPSLEETYPIFKNKTDSSEDWKLIKAQMSAAAEYNNAKWGEKS